MFLTDSFVGNLIACGVTLVTIIIAYYKWSFQYWKRRNVPYLEPTIPFGTSGSPLKRKEPASMTIRRNYDKMKALGWKHGGLYNMTRPEYVVLHLDYVKRILTKDFQYFMDHGVYYNEKDDPLSGHLFNVEGSRWRNLRMKLSPTFTSGKMKMMFHALMECEPNLIEKIEDTRRRNEPIDIKEVLGCFTTDIIGSCAFGLDCKTFKDENSPFRMYGKKTFNFTRSRRLKSMVSGIFPNLAKMLGFGFTPKDVEEFFIKVVKDTVEYREKNDYSRKDFMQLLIDLKNNRLADEEGYKPDGTSLTIKELAAQCFVFFLAGFETSSTTMTWVLYELARRPDLQQKVRDEIQTVLAKHQGKITYDAIQEMKYMDQVINETLRMYPPVPMLMRRCVKDYKVPDEDVIIEKGTKVTIPTIGIHYDKEYYPEPEKFDPERFNEENKSLRHSYAHLPFGEGPRICIGMRFGLMQSKVGLSSLLRNYKFTVSKKTKEPVKLKVYSFFPSAVGEIWLDAQKV